VTEQPPRRERVVSARVRAARVAPRRPVRSEIDEQTRVGQVYMRSLVRTQLRLALGVGSVFAVLFGGLPLLFVLRPRLTELEVLGLPLPWLLLGVLVHPVLVVGAWLFVRQAERNEREFVDLVHRS
jgi:hypothetical protein